MFKNIIIGQYYPSSSPLHRLDARLKIILTITYIAVLFSINSFISYTIFAVFLFAVMAISSVPVKLIIKGIRPVLWILLLTAVINLFAVSGEAIVSIHISKFLITITKEGIILAATLSTRLLFLISGASLLTLTTPPIMLTDALENLIRPLGKFKVPTQEIAMMMSIAIRFIPTISEEANKIYKAQISRGADFGEGNIIKRAKAMTAILIPLFVSAFRRADDLAVAMDARCYRSGNRTHLRQMHITRQDILYTVIFVLCAAVLLAAEFVIEF